MVRRWVFYAFILVVVNLIVSQELITSATTLGALLGGLVAGVLSDWTGRRLVLGIGDIIFIAGAIAQAVSHDVWSMVRISDTTVPPPDTHLPTDWRSISYWCRCRIGGMYSTSVYSRTFPDAPSWEDGGLEVRPLIANHSRINSSMKTASL